MAVWRCSICLVFICLTLRELLSHIHLNHGSAPNFHIVCGINGCPMRYTKYNGLYKHIRYIHADLYDTDGPNPGNLTDNELDETTERQTSLDMPERDDEQNEIVQREQREGSPSSESDGNGVDEFDPHLNSHRHSEMTMTMHAANFILGIKERNGLTQNAVDDIMNGTRRLIDQSLKHFSARLIAELPEQGPEGGAEINQEFIRDLVNDMQNQQSDMFQGLHSAYMQNKYFDKELKIIQPREIVLGERPVKKQTGSKSLIISKNDCAYYIPVIDNIKSWLGNERVRTMVLSEPECADGNAGFLADFCCGTIYRQHRILGSKNVVPLIMYYDEIDVCNPIGTSASIHKLGMFYISLGNIELKFRSRLSAIRLLMISSYKNIQRYGVDRLLQPFYDDMVTLSEGILFPLSGEEILLRGSLLAVVADTPASHLLGGFKEGVGGAYSKCRHCECSQEEMQEGFFENDFPSRNLVSHLQHCNEINNAATGYMKNHLKTTYGINRRSILASFPDFNVTKMLPQDIMHVMLEGVMQHEIKQVLYHFYRNEHLDLDRFNIRLRNFEYSYFDRKDRLFEIQPTVLSSEDSRLKQTASQMMVLIKLLPFLVMGLIQSDNEFYIFTMQLLNIYHILMAPVISCASLSLLKELIGDHLKKFKNLFPNLSILPKQHYMLHFPKLIKLFGPPTRYSCMRFEAKHQYFKKMASKQNFLNLSKSLSTRYQKAECISQVGEDQHHHPLFASELIVGPPKHLSHSELLHVKEQYSLFRGEELVGCSSAYSCKYVTVCGTRYSVDKSCLLVGSINSQPEFGLLKKIYILNLSGVFFECEMLDTLNFNEELQAYLVQKPDMAVGHEFCCQSDLIDYNCYSMITISDTLYIPIEYDLADLIDMHDSGILMHK